jgi:beta-lactamase regulating signal transducer with metallopeptidase domain
MPVTDTLLPSAMVPAVVPEVIVPLREFVVFPAQAEAPPLPIESVAVEPVRDWWRVAFILTAIVSSVLLFRLMLVLRQVLLIRKGSRPVSALDWDDVRTSSGYLLRSITLRESGSIAVPLTIGFWRPVLILPSDGNTGKDGSCARFSRMN